MKSLSKQRCFEHHTRLENFHHEIILILMGQLIWFYLKYVITENQDGPIVIYYIAKIKKILGSVFFANICILDKKLYATANKSCQFPIFGIS